MNLDLRAERQKRGWHLEDIADSTQIPMRYLAALEDNDLVVLPPGPFRRGYLRQYLEQLGIDGDSSDLPEDVSRELFGPVGELTLGEDDELAPIEGTSDTATIPRAEEIPVLRLVVTGFVLTLVVVMGLRLSSQVFDVSPAAADATDAIAMPVNSQVLHIRAVERTRVRIVVDGQHHDKTVIDAGESIEVAGNERIELDASDLTMLVVHHNDERIEPLHNLSHARRLVFVQDPTD